MTFASEIVEKIAVGLAATAAVAYAVARVKDAAATSAVLATVVESDDGK